MNSLHGLATRWTPLPSAPIGACRLRQRHQRNQAPSNLCILGATISPSEDWRPPNWNCSNRCNSPPVTAASNRHP